MVNPEAAAPGGTPSADMMPPADPEMGGGQPATPEQQEQYDKFVAQGFNLIYDDKFLSKVKGMLEGEGDPIEGLARTAALVVARVASSAEEAGQGMTPEVGLHAGTELFEDLADLSKKFGIKDFEADPDALEGAYFRALDHVRLMMQESGKLHPEAAKADLAKLQAMDESGELEGMFLDLARNDKRSSKPVEKINKPKSRGLMPKEEEV